MANTQLETLAVLIADKLNHIIGRVNDNTTTKADLSGADFTGDVSFSRISSNVVPSQTKQFDLGNVTESFRSAFIENLIIPERFELSINNTEVVFKKHNTDGTYSESIRLLEGGIVRINNSYNLPSTDGSVGQVLATDGNGNIIFKTLENESSDFAQYILTYDFTTNGTTTEYTVNATTLNKIIYVELNGLIQKEGTDFTVNNKTITFTDTPPIGMSGTIKFWGNDITSVISSTDFITDGQSTNFTTDTKLNKIVLVELNGLIQKQGTDYTVDVANNTVIFSEIIPSGSTGTIVYV